MNQQIKPSTMNAQPDENRGGLNTTESLCQVRSKPQRHEDTENVPTPPVLRWYADEDGDKVEYRLRENEDRHSCETRARVNGPYTNPDGWLWFAWKPEIGGMEEGHAPTLELAKAAAERAVEEMDGEGE